MIYKRHFFAQNGENGSSRGKHGKNGENLEILVPLGTIIIDTSTQKILKDLDNEGETFIAAKGGIGGRGNKHFATSVERTPHYSEKGSEGEEKRLELKLKILSDVGIVGAPNAGKSTLLSKVSNAKPKIADYPFTTLSPKIGVVDLGINKRFVIADLPGLIEGAHKGKGMGNQFLSHVERTKILLFLIDGTYKTQIKNTYKMLLDEIESYSEELLNRKRIVAINKIDNWRVKRKKEIQNFFDQVHEEVFFISALKGDGIEELLERLYELVSTTKREETIEEEVVIDTVKSKKEAIRIERLEKNVYRVYNAELERRVALTDFNKYWSVNELIRYFDKIELENLLKKEGVKEGDRILIGEKSFIFKEDK